METKIRIGYTNGRGGFPTSRNVWVIAADGTEQIFRLPPYIGKTGRGANALARLVTRIGLTPEQAEEIRRA